MSGENAVQANVSVYACVCQLWEGWQQRSRPRGHHVLMGRRKTWVAMVAMGHTSRESLGVGVLAVPSRGMWEYVGASEVPARTEDFVGTVERKFAGEMSVVCARQT